MEYLFHYTKEIHINDILKNQTLLINNIYKTNDPYENKKFDMYESKELDHFNINNAETDYGIHPIHISYEDIEYSEKYEEDLPNLIKNKLDEIECNQKDFYFKNLTNMKNRKTRTISFCNGIFVKKIDENNRPGYFYPRMWSQYGNNSRGICIVLKKNQLINAIRKQLSDKYEIFYGDIEYTNILKKSHAQMISQLIIKRNKKTFRNKIPKKWPLLLDDIKENFHEYFFIKDEDWLGEHEYRIVLINKPRNNFIDPLIVKFDMSKILECVVLGENYTYRNEDEEEVNVDKSIGYIKSLCKEHNIKLLKLNRDIYRSKYQVETLL
jgi:hypothetical protein